MKILFLLILSFFIGLGSAFIIFRFGSHLGLLDMPSERSAHYRPVPKGGGIGIPIAVGLITFQFLNIGYFLVGLSLILSFVALINDRTEIPVIFRLILEFMLGLILILFYKKELINLQHNFYDSVVLLFLVIFLAIYIVAATNFFNFMDGINGIAGFEALISFSLLGVFAFTYKNLAEISLIAFSVAAASVGFLLINFPKAKVFMGDVGSIFIGFIFAGMVVFLASNVKEFLLLTIFQSLFYIDCISTILVRLLNKENVLKAHKKHLYQKLVHCSGWSHSKVAVYFGLSQLLIGFLGLWLFRLDIIFLAIFWGVLLTIYWSILIGFKFIKTKDCY